MRTFLGLTLVAAVVLQLDEGTKTPDLKAKDAETALKEINTAARAAYAAGRERTLAGLGPVVLWNGQDLVFRYGNIRRVTQPTPALYHDLKTVGHVPLGLHALVTSCGEAELNDRQVFELKQYREVIRKALVAIRQRGLAKELLDRQERILKACDEYLTAVLDENRVDLKKMVSHLRRMRPWLDENSVDAAKAQITALHREMQAYRGKLSGGAWKQLVVIVQGSQMPRKENLAVQYFSRLLGEEGEGKRIVYAEAIFDEAKALALLGTRLQDTRIGKDVWADPDRMHRDLLADGAKASLDEMFGKREP